MEVFGAITAAITVLQQIIRVYEQAGQNANDGVTLSNDIIDFLTHIEDHLRQQPLSITDSLRNDLTEFENSLREILRRHQRLMGHNVNGLWARSTAKLKAFSNASDIQHQLVELHRNIQTCCQKLQISCAVRTDVGVAVITEHMTALRQDTNGLIAEMHQSQETMRRTLQLIASAIIPGSSPERMAILEQIQENIQDQVTTTRTHTTQVQQSNIIGAPNISQTALSHTSIRGSERSFNSTDERRLLRSKVKELIATLPQLRNQAPRRNSILWLDPFRGLEMQGASISTANREDSIEETKRVLRILRSGKKISYIDAARDLLGLARALGNLGMRKEAGEMYDWGVYICREVALSGNSKTLFDLGTFLHKLFKELASRGQSDEAERVLDEAIQTRRRLAERKQWSYLDKLASSMWRVALHLNTLGHGAAVVSAIREVVNIHRHLVGHNAVVFLPHLACALDGLMVALSGLDMDEDAVKAGEEVLTIWRNLAEHRHEQYLSSLACSQYSLVLSMERLTRHEEAKGIELEAAATCRRLMVKNEAPPLLRAAIKERLLEPSVMSRSLLLDTIDKAIERAATKSSQDAWMSVLIRRLRDLAMYRRNYERYEDSARSEEVAIDVVRDLLKTGGEAQLRSLAQSLCRLAFDLSKLGRVDDVTKIGEEVVEAFQLLVQTDQIQGNHNELEVALHHLSLNLFRRGIREGTTWVDNEIIVNISELAALVSGRDN